MPERGSSRGPSREGSEDRIAVTMTRDAARRLFAALVHGSVVLEDHPRWSEDAQWLRWATGRLVHASPEVLPDLDGGHDVR